MPVIVGLFCLGMFGNVADVVRGYMEPEVRPGLRGGQAFAEVLRTDVHGWPITAFRHEHLGGHCRQVGPHRGTARRIKQGNQHSGQQWDSWAREQETAVCRKGRPVHGGRKEVSSTCGRMLTCSWMMKKESVMVSTVAQGTKGQRKRGREREREREGGRKRHSRIHSSEDVMCWSHVRRCDPRYSDGERKGSARGVADLRGRESHRVAVT